MFHEVDEAYNQWAFSKWPIIQSREKDENLLTIDNLATELMDKVCATIKVEAKTIFASKIKHFCDRGGFYSKKRCGKARRWQSFSFQN